MMNNYNSLNYRKDSKFSSREPDVVGNAPNSEGVKRTSWLMSLLLFISFMLVNNNIQAQVGPPTSGAGLTNGYAFAQTSGSYVPLSASRTIWQSNATLGTDLVSSAISLPWNFNFNGKVYNSIRISNNGFITFGANPALAATYTALSTNTNPSFDGAIAGFAVNLRNATTTTSEIAYETVGSDFVIQFTDLQGNAAAAAQRITFQIRLTQTTNLVKIVYGTCVSGTAALTAQVGMKGGESSDMNNRTGTNWTATTAGTATTSTCTLGTTGGTTIPASGLTFTYTPGTWVSSAATYATLPFTESFTTWANGNATGDLPNATNWRTWPARGDNSWRANNHGVSGFTSASGWTTVSESVTTAIATPAVAPTARFHSYDTSVGSIGYMDLYVDLSSGGAGTRNIAFDYRNQSGTDVLQLQLSTDGGATFANLGAASGVATSWTNVVRTTTSTSSTAILRFLATSDFGNDDIFIDNLNITVVGCVAPNTLTASNITLNSASLGWTESGTATNWDVEYGLNGFTPTGTPTASTTSNPYSATGLTANTTYQFYVRANCGASQSTWVGPYSFFTGYCLPTGGSSSTTYYLNSIAVSGGQSNFSNTASSYAAYVNNSATSCSQYPGGTFGLSLAAAGGSTYYYYCWIDWNNDLDFLDAGETMVATSTYASTYSSTTLAVPAGQAIGSYKMRVATSFSGAITSCGPAPYGNYVDYTFNVVAVPTCFVPTALTTSSLTSNGVTLGWTAPTSGTPATYDYYVSTTNTAPTGSTTPTGSVTAPTVSAVLTGLTANTTYYYWVRTSCSASDKSGWAGFSTFTTPCAPLSLNVVQGFNAATMPSCWSQQFVSGSLGFTFPTTGTGTPAPTPQEGTNQVMYNSYSNSTQTRLVSAPFITTGSSSIDVNFQWYQSNNGGATLYLTEGVTVQYSTDGSTWTSVGSQILRYNATTGWSSKTVTLPLAAGNQPIVYVGFLFQGNGGYDTYLDNVSITPTPSCFIPTAVTASAVTTSGATISWTAPVSGTPASYQYEVRASGVAGSGASGLTANGTVTAPTATATVTGLSAQTTYSVYVRTFCGGSDYSAWTSATTFTTPCNAVSTFPFTETFDATSTSLGCWGVSAGTGAAYQWGVTTADATYGVAGPAASTRFAFLNVFNAVTTYNTYNLFTPSFTLDATPKRFKYNYFLGTGGYKGTTGATGTDPYPLQVLISVNGAAYTALYAHSSSNSTFATTNATTGWQSNIIDLTAYAGQTIKLVFVSNSNYGSGTCNQAIDEVTVETIPTAISSFSPAAVCSQAGSTITINGAAFTGATAVKFNGVNATSFTVVSNTQITAVAPLGVTAGYITINGVNNIGTSATTLAVTNNPPLSAITIVPTISAPASSPTCLNLDDTSDNIQLNNSYPGGTWSSSDISIATVDGSGLVTPLAEGTVTITYTASAGTTPTCYTSVTKVITINKPVGISASTAVQTVLTGNNASFSVTATGTGLSYQWYESPYDALTYSNGPFTPITNGGVYGGATSSTLTITGTPGNLNGYQYYCTVSGTSPCGAVDSNPATLNVGDTGITGDPADVSLCETGSGTATFTVVPSGTVNSYVWYENQGLGFNAITDGTFGGVTYNTSTLGTLSLSGLTTANNSWTYKVDVVGPANTATSNPALLTINQSASFASSPSNQTVCYTGGSATFGATLTGNYSGVQWQYSTDNSSWNNVANGTPVGATYTGTSYTGNAYTGSLGMTTTASTPVSGTYYYRALAYGAAPCSNASSSSAQLIINNPTITTAPVAASVIGGGTATFSVVSNATTPTYQWQSATTLAGPYSNVVDLTPATVTYTGATSSTLSVVTTTATAASTANFYRCIVTSNGTCSVASTGAQLTISNYCTIPASTSTASYFDAFTTSGGVTNINNTASGFSPGGYGSFIAQSASQLQGQSVSFTTTLAGPTVGVAIWVDWNQNAVFETTERVANTTGYISVFSGSFTVPVTAIPGNTRMRIMMDYNNSNPTSACPTTGGRREVEDYTFTVLVPPACSGTPVAGTISSSVANVCFTGTATLTANGYSTGVTGISFQWFNSAGAISGATSTTYTTPVLSASETYYLRVTCVNGGAYADTNSVTIGVDAPAVTSTTPGTRCGTGTVVLGATGSTGNTLSWYAAATGGSPLGTGTSFTTPSIATTTNYYVSANVGGSSFSGGKPSTNGAEGTNTTGGIYFTANTAFNLNSVVMYPQGSGTNTIVLYAGSATSGTPIYTTNYTFTGASSTGVTVPLNWNIAPGSYTIYQSVSNASCFRDSGTTSLPVTAYPYNIGSACTLTDGTLSGFYYFFYNWGISTGCSSARTAVTATVTAPPALSISSTSSSVCNGLSTTTPVTVTSTLSNYDTYTWSPTTGVSGSAASGYTFNPTATTTYTLTATNAAGCANTVAHTVTVNALPSAFVVSPATSTVCSVGLPVMLAVAPSNPIPSPTACTEIGNGQYPSTAFTPTTCDGTTANSITTVAYAGEYSVVNTSSNTIYTFSSSLSGDYVTIMDSTGATVLAYGPSPVTWYNASQTSVRFISVNGTCTADSTSRTRSVICKPVGSVVFTPSAGLYTDAAGTIAYTGTAVTSVYARPSTTTTYTATATNASGCIRTATSTVNVNPASIGGTASATASQLCTGFSTTLSLTGNVGTIQWQQAASASGPWTNVSGATSASLNTGNLTATTYYQAVVTSGVCSSSTSNVVTVTVSPLSVAGSATGTATICSGTATTLTLTGSTGSIQWQQASSAIGPWSNVSGANSVSLNTGNLTATTYYQAVVTSGVCSSATSNSVTVTVNPVSVGGTASSTASTLCAGFGTSLSLTGYTGTIQWQQASSASGPWTDISGATSASLNTGNLTATTYYQASVTSGVCSASTSNVVTVTVNPLPTVTVSLGSAVICPNTTTTITAVPGTAGSYSYVWTVPSGATNPGNVATFTSGVAGVYRVVITNTATGCVSAQASSSPITISTTCSTLVACGTTLTNIDDTILSSIVANAQGYRWRVTKMINGVPSTNPADVQYLDTLLRALKITQLTSYAFDTQYQVEVAVRLNNVWATYYGSACSVRTPATTTKITSTQCGSTVALMTDVVYADIVPFSTGYRFKATNLLNQTDVQIVDRPLREFRFSLLSNVQFSTPYKIEVAVRNTDGTYLPYGQPCTVTTPLFPTSQLQASQCDYTATSVTEVVYANIVSNATAYRFLITNSSLSYSYTFDSTLRSFQLNTIPGLVGSTTYTVQVAVQIGGTFGPYGKSCTLTTPAALNAKTIVDVTALPQGTKVFEAMALPNPFADNFKLDVKTSSEEVLQVKVYDMLGKLVDSREVNTTDVQTLEVGTNYPSGVYNVIVTQGENTKTLRVIKR